MPRRKVYMIVTNDEYETPIACDVVGAKTVSDFLGISYSKFYNNMINDNWKYLEYKAIDLGYVDEQEEFEPNILNISKEEAERNVINRKRAKHEFCKANEKKKRKALYKKDREKILEEKKEYYQNHREERCKYASEYYQLKKMGLKGKIV